jgi:hypothetical protein
MMHEILTNGPIVVAFNAAPDLYYYSSGVFITNPSNRLRKLIKIIYSNKVNLMKEKILNLGSLQIMLYLALDGENNFIMERSSNTGF